MKSWWFSEIGGHKPVEGFLSWRGRCPPFSLKLNHWNSTRPIYILGKFGGIWSSERGGLKLEGSSVARAVRNSSSWRGSAVYWPGSLIFSLILNAASLWRIGSLLRQPLGGTYLCIAYYCIDWQPILILLGFSSRSADLLYTGSPYYLNKGQIWHCWFSTGVLISLVLFMIVCFIYIGQSTLSKSILRIFMSKPANT